MLTKANVTKITKACIVDFMKASSGVTLAYGDFLQGTLTGLSVKFSLSEYLRYQNISGWNKSHCSTTFIKFPVYCIRDHPCYYVISRVYWLCYSSICWSNRRHAYSNFSSFVTEQTWLLFKKTKKHHKFTGSCWLEPDIFRCLDWFSKQCARY